MYDFKIEVIEKYGDYYKKLWSAKAELDMLSYYLSDSGLCIYTTRDKSIELLEKFKSWGLDAYQNWYGGDTYRAGIQYYSYEKFDELYEEYKFRKISEERNDKINSILV
jgi:hypothetical protein